MGTKCYIFSFLILIFVMLQAGIDIVWIIWSVNSKVPKSNNNYSNCEVVPERFTINLDLPPEQRWIEIMLMKNIEAQQMLDELKVAAKSYGIIETVWNIISDLFAYRAKYTWDVDYFKEVEGISQITGVRLGDIVVGQVLYEIQAACTSIVAQDDEGNIWHGRNLDFDIVTRVLRQALIQVDFKKNGKLLYSSLTWPGYVGSLTGQKPGAFSLSLNTRRIQETMPSILINFIKTNVGRPQSFALRYALENLETFDEAVQYLQTEQFTVPSLLIIGGVKKGDGVVLTRNPENTEDSWYIKDGYPDDKPWYVLSTNYDHWKLPPTSDDRRNPAIKAMKKEGQKNMGPAALLRVLSTKPVLDMSRTVFSTVMSASQPEVMKQYTTTYCA